jgi:hypothetical protein
MATKVFCDICGKEASGVDSYKLVLENLPYLGIEKDLCFDCRKQLLEYLEARKKLYDERELLNLKQELEDTYGSVINSLSVSKTNSLNYLQVTIVYK